MLELHCLGANSDEKIFQPTSHLARWQVRSFSNELNLAAAIRSDGFVVDASWPGWREALREVRRVGPQVVRVLLNSKTPVQQLSDLPLFHRVVNRHRVDCIEKMTPAVIHARSLVADTDVRRALLSIDSLPIRSDSIQLADQLGCSAEAFAQTIEQDASIASALLKCRAELADEPCSVGHLADSLDHRQ